MQQAVSAAYEDVLRTATEAGIPINGMT